MDGTVDNKYEYSLTGKGVEIYIFDTGVNPTHEEFSDRVSCGYSAVSGEDCTDYRGHGSHVTGTAIGTTYGVAKEATVVAIKVLAKDGTGTISGVLSGLEFVANKKLSNKNQPMVASKCSLATLCFLTRHDNSSCILSTDMSLGGESSDLINNAVSNAIAAGVVFVVSAGNDGGLACDKSPASCADAITVSAIDTNNNRPFYGNYGSCVDIFGWVDGCPVLT